MSLDEAPLAPPEPTKPVCAFPPCGAAQREGSSLCWTHNDLIVFLAWWNQEIRKQAARAAAQATLVVPGGTRVRK